MRFTWIIKGSASSVIMNQAEFLVNYLRLEFEMIGCQWASLQFGYDIFCPRVDPRSSRWEEIQHDMKQVCRSPYLISVYYIYYIHAIFMLISNMDLKNMSPYTTIQVSVRDGKEPSPIDRERVSVKMR